MNETQVGSYFIPVVTCLDDDGKPVRMGFVLRPDQYGDGDQLWFLVEYPVVPDIRATLREEVLLSLLKLAFPEGGSGGKSE